MRGDLCPRKHCRTALVITTNGNGVTIATCRPCERNKRGLCRDCPAPLAKAGAKPGHNAMRCARCALAWLALKKKRAYHADPDKFRLQRRQSSRRPHVHERYMKYRAEWVKRNPRGKPDEIDRMYHRAWRAKYFSDPKNRAHVKAWARRYRSDPAVRERQNAAARRRRAQQKARAA